MPTPDLVTLDTLQQQLGAAYARYPASEQARLATLVQAIQRPDDIALHTEARESGNWTVAICTSDRLGALSVIAGLFASFRLDILSADIFTIRRPSPPAARRQRPPLGRPATPTRLLLDIFEVRALAPAAPNLWQRFHDDLAALVQLLVTGQREQARDDIIDRISAAFQETGATNATLLPIDIDLTNESGAAVTRMTVRSGDTPGFLFAFTNALAGFTINIERAEIRTHDGEANDAFWVTDTRGGPITGEAQSHALRAATILIKQFTYLLPRSPDPGQALRQFNALIAQILSRPQWTTRLADLESPDVLETLANLMGVSRFLWEDFLRMQHENLFPVIVDLPALTEPRSPAALRTDLVQALAALETPAARVDALNAFKDREMFRIDLRHITGRSDFAQFAEELSQLAEATVAIAADLAAAAVARSVGSPTLKDGQPCPWSMCALGKFGGGELGFGSDLELMVVYGDEGVTSGPTAISNAEYFSRLVQTFLGIVHSRQAGIFEIDLRLRPFGKAGGLASSLDGFRRYYSAQGAAEQFERMALVRLRSVAGDLELGKRVAQARDAFVYSSQPLDLGNILHLRRRQATELTPAGQISAKYSAGGLVDVEYFVQAWQIATGHADSSVRVANTLAAIGRLEAGGHMPAALAERLRASYGFLRQLIDALRVVRGHAKDLTIPPASTREFAYLAHRLRFDSATDLQAAITKRMADSHSVWDEAPPPSHGI